MAVFVPWICTHINQMTFLTAQIPICILQYLITSKKITCYSFPDYFFFLKALCLFCSYKFLLRLLQDQRCSHRSERKLWHRLWRNLKPALGNTPRTNFKMSALWKTSSWCWETCPASDEVCTHADPKSWEPLWRHQAAALTRRVGAEPSQQDKGAWALLLHILQVPTQNPVSQAQCRNLTLEHWALPSCHRLRLRLLEAGEKASAGFKKV